MTDHTHLLTSQWARGLIPNVEGLFLSSDLGCEMSGDPSLGYFVGPLVPLATLVSSASASASASVSVLDDMLWFPFADYETCRFTHGRITVVAGGTAWEGAGFVVAEHEVDGLLWVLHLETAEAFTSVRIVDSVVVAAAQCYPNVNTFEIPVFEPQRFGARRDHAA